MYAESRYVGKWLVSKVSDTCVLNGQRKGWKKTHISVICVMMLVHVVAYDLLE